MLKFSFHKSREMSGGGHGRFDRVNKLLEGSNQERTVLSLKMKEILYLSFASLILASFGSMEQTPTFEMSKEYCVVGSGPGGLQIAYFLQKKNRDYIVFERANEAGAFFKKFPIHRKLISINKVWTGSENKEFNLRHDWNSLINDFEVMFSNFSTDYFPHADKMVDYLNHFASYHNLNIQYNTPIVKVSKTEKNGMVDPDGHFIVQDANNKYYDCKILIMTMGRTKPNRPPIKGGELIEGYEDQTMNPEDYKGQRVLILGRGNSAMETADFVAQTAAYVHNLARSAIRFSFQTHYVGDVRAINDNFVDQYQLKSLDGLAETDRSLSELEFSRTENGRISVLPIARDQSANFAFREPYDRVISALGWKFDPFMFQGTNLVLNITADGKYPEITPEYESTSIKNLYFCGTTMHSLDFRKSSGGFIHGFRYLIEALHHILEKKVHNVPWPSEQVKYSKLVDHLINRVNEASSLYQMFGVLVDVILVKQPLEDGKVPSFEYFNGVPLALLKKFVDQYNEDRPADAPFKPIEHVLVVSFEYAPGYHGPKVFDLGRTVASPQNAHLSNFLHPIIRHYHTSNLTRAIHTHHIMEDFLTQWSTIDHVDPLRVFVRKLFREDGLDANISQPETPPEVMNHEPPVVASRTMQSEDPLDVPECSCQCKYSDGHVAEMNLGLGGRREMQQY